MLIGTSLGAAVAMQAAADDPRVSVVVAAETFADLRSIAADRAPAFFSAKVMAKAFAIAEERGRFKVDDVSPLKAAARISVPVLVVHGQDDVATSPDHSRRVFAALRGPKQLTLVPDAKHNQSLRPHVWEAIDEWLKVRGFGLETTSRRSSH